MKVRRCFGYSGFGHMVCYCRNVGNKKPAQVPSNRFEVLRDRVMQREEGSRREIVKDRRKILREKKAKRGVEVRQIKIKGKEKKEKKKKTLRKIMVKIGLK